MNPLQGRNILTLVLQLQDLVKLSLQNLQKVFTTLRAGYTISDPQV